MTDICIGVATPQANPTVEIELQQFFRGPARAIVTRLQSDAHDTSQRLVDYIEQLPDTVASFGGMPLSGVAFACTGSAYLVGHEREDELREMTERRHRVQVVTATQAIRRELEGRAARRVAMLAPYPAFLCEKAIAYWRSIGFEIVATQRIDVGENTRNIYSITSEQVSAALQSFDTENADVVLLSGTGMPTIDALRNARKPLISSNLCLATEMLRRSQLWPPRDAADIRKLLEKH